MRSPRITHAEAYRVLGVRPPFSADELKSAYRKAAKKHHPDRGGNATDFTRAKDAFDLLQPEVGKPAAAPPPKPKPDNPFDPDFDPTVAKNPYWAPSTNPSPEDLRDFIRRMQREAEAFRGGVPDPRQYQQTWDFFKNRPSEDPTRAYNAQRAEVSRLRRVLSDELDRWERVRGPEKTIDALRKIIDVLWRAR